MRKNDWSVVVVAVLVVGIAGCKKAADDSVDTTITSGAVPPSVSSAPDFSTASSGDASSLAGNSNSSDAVNQAESSPGPPTASVPTDQGDQSGSVPAPTLSEGQYLNSANGQIYEYVDAPGISWAEAARRAASKSINGRRGHLATIKSRAELNFIESTVIPGGPQTANVFIGGRRVPGTQAVWQWAAGPYAGRAFWNNGPTGGAPTLWDPIYALGQDAPAGPSNDAEPYLYLNGWHRPYFTATFGTALDSVNAGGNSGYIVQY